MIVDDCDELVAISGDCDIFRLPLLVHRSNEASDGVDVESSSLVIEVVEEEEDEEVKGSRGNKPPLLLLLVTPKLVVTSW